MAKFQVVVKAVNSGDSVTLIKNPKTREEVTFIFSNVIAPKLARRPKPGMDVGTAEEKYAWESREFLRQKIIGKVVYCVVEKEKDPKLVFGTLFFPTKDDNITKLLVEQGLVTVRNQNPELKKAEEFAKSQGRGIHNSEGKPIVRNIVWEPEPKFLLEKFGKKVVRGVIETINATMVIRAFILPDHYYVAFCFSGIKVVRESVNDVRQFLEERILHRDVKIILESVQNERNKILNATVIHEGQNCNIGELLVREGYASCNMLLQGVHDEKKLREAEKKAQNEKKGKWQNFVPKKPPKERAAIVLEVINGDALMIRYLGETKDEKIFLSSIRPPKNEQAPVENKSGGRNKPLYEVPWLFEAREFLRTRLIGKKVNVSEDFIQPTRENYLEKKCCTVSVGQENIAEALVSKGLATCVRYREDEENKSPYYEKLRQAEEKAQKSLVGVWANEKDIPIHRVIDASTDLIRAKCTFSSLKRLTSIEGVVEFVASGSRYRVYIDRESCLITFLLGGISCPRASRPAGPASGKPTERLPSEEFGEEALDHVKKLVLQRNVELKVESMDKRGGIIGWMFLNNVNISVELVEQGFAELHETAERSIYYRALKQAQDKAKELRLRRWQNYKEEDDVVVKEKNEDAEVKSDRKVNYVEHVVAVVPPSDDLTIYAQKVSEASKIDNLTARLRQEFTANAPVIGAYTPRRPDLCAAKFSADQEWYRAKVEKVTGRKANIFFIDYGNRETVDFNDLTFLPEAFKSEPGYAHEYKLAFVKLPPEDYRPDSIQRLEEELENKKVLINIEYTKEASYVTVYDMEKQDIIKGLVAQGYFFVDHRRDRRLQKLIDEYKSAEDEALKKRYNIWEYGDIRGEDDDHRGF